MSHGVHHYLALAAAWLRTGATRLAHQARRLWRRFRPCRGSIAVEVLVADRTRRKVLEREIKMGLARLQRALGASLLADVSVIVQQVTVTDHQVAGCCQVGQRADGEPFALVRLALQVDGSLEWSYGSIRGRPDAAWQIYLRDHVGPVAGLPGLLGMGFTGGLLGSGTLPSRACLRKWSPG
mgnify:CR=1 FL=1